MPSLHLSEIAFVLNGDLHERSGDRVVSDYHFDSRRLSEGALFFALRSEGNDGHRYLEQVAEARGGAAVVARDYDGESQGLPLIRVDDTALAYRQLAIEVRRRFEEVRYVAITGSAGKTTTKEFTHQLLSHSLRSFRSPGNWNNWLGVPFALLKMPDDAEAAVFELAMSFPGIGEIERMVEVLRPRVAVVLNIFPVHLEFLGTLENVARAKLEIAGQLRSDDVLILPGDEPLVTREVSRLPGRKLLFGRRRKGNDAVLRSWKREHEGSRLEIELEGRELTFATHLVNEAQLENLFVSILVAHSLGMVPESIQEAAREVAPVAGRGMVHRVAGVTLIDDTYNANPEAVKKVVEWVARSYPRPRIAVIGDMLELGEVEDLLHREVGRHLAALDYDHLVLVGERARWIGEGARAAGMGEAGIQHCSDPDAAARLLAEIVETGMTVLFKASRGVALERALEALRRELEGER